MHPPSNTTQLGVRDALQSLPADVHGVRFVRLVAWPSTDGRTNDAAYVVNGLDTYWNARVMLAAIESGAIDVAESADGGILAVTHVEELNTRDLVMWKPYVLPDRRRLGIGRALVGAAKERARVHGGDLVTEFAATNERVRPLRPGGRPLRR